MPNDKLTITILDDGTIKVEADQIGAANHKNADEFLAFLARLAGGAVDVKQRRGHHHGHQHQHEAQGA